MIKPLLNLILFAPNIKAMSTLTASKLPDSIKDQFQKLFTPELNILNGLFIKYNYELRIAGGAVRDLLMGKLPADIDFATTATPVEMKTMFEREQIRLIKTNGEKHGTITCRINDKENFEVTTLRIDVETNGRHAKVEFTKDWQLDAERRDLTINSMFLGLNGIVYDYFGGHNDLLNRRIRFVGNPSDRIKEDYLRILRYFRFYGRIAEKPNNHEEASLSAMRDNADGLKGISGERILVELKKIVASRFAESNFETMQDLGINHHLGFTGSLNFPELGLVHERCLDLNPNPIMLIAALLSQQSQLESLHRRVKLSNSELQIATFILNYRDTFSSLQQQKESSRNNVTHTHINQDSDNVNLSGSHIQTCPPYTDLVNKSDLFIQNKANTSTENNPLAGNRIHPLNHEFNKNAIDPFNKNYSLEESDPLFEQCRDLILDPTVTTQGLAKTKLSIRELLKYVNARSTLFKVDAWDPPRFPVDGTRLVEMNVPKGPEFSKVLKRLRDKWRESRYVATEEELLRYVKKRQRENT